MKIAFIYGHYAIGDRYFDLNNLWSSSRGLTGSEISYFSYAREMHKLGHEVHLFITGPCINTDWEGMRVHPYDSISIIDSSWDVAYSWHEPNLLQHTSPKLRVVNQQLNDFDYCTSGFDQFVDLYTSPSRHHMEHVSQSVSSIDKWEVVPNGCYPDSYSPNKIPGRVIYASSPDRGLHNVLQVWPIVKKIVPEATLRIFYNIDPFIQRFSPIEININKSREYVGWIEPHIEFSCRARYLGHAIQRMEHLGVEKHGCVSRERMCQEMSEATILAYPCDTVRYTEGFSVTTLEACASRTLPIITGIDALGSIYGECACLVETPVPNHLDKLAEYVVRGLVDPPWRNKYTDKCHEFSLGYSWQKLTLQLESILTKRLEGKL